MTGEFWPLSFERFLDAQTGALRKIASKTRGSHSLDDLQSEAWLISIQIGKRWGASIDLASPATQTTVLAWLYKRFVDYVDGKLKHSLDHVDDDAIPWHERLAAPQELEPLAQLERTVDEAIELPTKGFSQFTAYMILLKRCELNLTKLAAYLDVSFKTLQRRVEAASEHANLQPSMFDSIEAIPAMFEPRAQIIRERTKKYGLCPLTSWVRQTAETLKNVGRQLMFLPLSRRD